METNTNQGIFIQQPQPQGIQDLSDIPPQPIGSFYAQEVRLNKLKQLQVSLSYYKDEMTYPLKKINGDESDVKKTLKDYFLENGITEFGPVFKVSMLDILKIDTALMKEGYYPNFIDCYSNQLKNPFEEARVVHDFCKYQLALVKKYETEQVSEILNTRLSELLRGDNVEVLNSLTMTGKKGLIFWMSNFVPKISENIFLNKLFEFDMDMDIADYVYLHSSEYCEDTFDYFEHVFEVADCTVKFVFLSETSVAISLIKKSRVLSYYTLKIKDGAIYTTREKVGE